MHRCRTAIRQLKVIRMYVRGWPSVRHVACAHHGVVVCHSWATYGRRNCSRTEKNSLYVDVPQRIDKQCFEKIKQIRKTSQASKCGKKRYGPKPRSNFKGINVLNLLQCSMVLLWCIGPLDILDTRASISNIEM